MSTTRTKTQASPSTLTAPVLDAAGKALRSQKLNAALFGVPTNAALVSEVLVSAQANRRHPIAHTKTRGEIRGGGKKPWRQKGTGRARQGSSRSPQWRHGGVVFGPTNARNFTRKINAKARQAVVRMLLSALAETGQLRLVDGLRFQTTKQAARFLNASAETAHRPLLLTATTDRALLRSARNLSGVSIRSLERLGVLDLALTDELILDVAALQPLTARYGAKASQASSASKASEASVATEAHEAHAKKVGRSSKSTSTAGGQHV